MPPATTKENISSGLHIVYDLLGDFLTIRKGRMKKAGEIHAPIYTKGGFRWASYMGPGTHMMDNLKSGVEPISKTDKVAQAHDIRYALANSSTEIRDADIKMINKILKLQKNKEDYKFNIYVAKLPIQAKMKLEDWGLLSKKFFAGNEKMSSRDESIARSKLKELEVHGYGLASSGVYRYAKRYKIRLTTEKNRKRVKKTQHQLKMEIKNYEKNNIVRKPMFK